MHDMLFLYLFHVRHQWKAVRRKLISSEPFKTAENVQFAPLHWRYLLWIGHL